MDNGVTFYIGKYKRTKPTITVILGAWDHCVDERDLTVDQWKDLIYKEVVDYEISKGKKFLFQSDYILPSPHRCFLAKIQLFKPGVYFLLKNHSLVFENRWFPRSFKLGMFVRIFFFFAELKELMIFWGKVIQNCTLTIHIWVW